jgi:SAM-dependent methyltransferase
MGQPYDGGFFDGQRDGSRDSAKAILPPLIEALRPQSIVDVGCGTGVWLLVAQSLGVGEVLGIDGPWAQSSLVIPAECFQAADLREGVIVTRRFDLAICLEAGEHLPSENAPSLVASLVALTPVILFSAAVPGQGGVDHVNEQWPDYWAHLFSVHGYRQVDAIRSRYWESPAVMPWYAQNAFLYVAADTAVDIEEARLPQRVIHPSFAHTPETMRREYSVRAVLGYVRQAVRWHWGLLRERLRGLRVGQ